MASIRSRGEGDEQESRQNSGAKRRHFIIFKIGIFKAVINWTLDLLRVKNATFRPQLKKCEEITEAIFGKTICPQGSYQVT